MFTIAGFTQKGFPIDDQALLPLAAEHGLHRIISDYLSANFRDVMDEEIRRSAVDLGALNVQQRKEMYIHLVNFCTHSGIHLLLYVYSIQCML
jgi:hypothetical protein